MKLAGVLLIIVGLLGLVAGGMMFGDIGVAAWIAAFTALISGFGFFRVAGQINTLKKQKEV